MKKLNIKNLVNKKWFARGALAVGAIALSLSIPFSFNSKENPLTEKYQSASDKAESSYVVHAEGKPADKGMWTLYAQLLMSDKDIKKSSAQTGQMNLLGQGGVSADFPYADIAKQGNSLTDSKAGTELASTLATYSYYGYMETVSGNALASGASGVVGGIGRALGSFIGSVSLAISNVAEGINDAVGKFFMHLNIFNLMGFGKSQEKFSDPISKALGSLLSNLGLDNSTFKVIANFMVLIFCGIFGWQAIRALSKEGVNSKGFLGHFKKWMVRILVLFILLPIEGSLIGGIISTIQYGKDSGELPTNTVQNYIINTRLWASTQNLSPAGEGNTDVPSGNGTSAIRYVDTSYEPSKKTDMISRINLLSYTRQKGGDGDADANVVGMALLKEWSSNDTFNINTFAGDVNLDKSDESRAPVVSAEGNKTLTDKGVNPRNLNQYIWSANQNVTDDNRKPDGKGTKPSGKGSNGSQDPVSFDASAPWGVKQNSTFSTQSLALLLQSEMNTSGTKFYAYNIAPSGVQGAAKNMSTVKTEWRTASLVGHGVIGKFGSWLAMIAESLVLAILYLACGWALLNVNIVKAFKREFARVWGVVLTGSPADGAGAFAISLGMIVTGFIANQLPIILIMVTRAVGDTATGLLPNEIIGDGINNIVRALMVLGMAYILVFSKKGSTSVINTIIGLPLEIAFGLDERAKLIMGTRNDAVRMVDGVSKAIKKGQGAKNPYYDGSITSAVAGGLGAVGANKLSDRLNGINDINADSQKVAKNLVSSVPTGSTGENGVGSPYNSSFKDLVRRDQLNAKDQQYTDPLGRLVNDKGEFVDAEGNKLDGKNGVDSQGNLVDDKGRLIDENGNLIDKDGNPIEDRQLTDEDGNPIKDQKIGMDADGHLIDEQGRLVDEDGNLIDEQGRKLLNSDFGRDANGRLVDDKGRLVDEYGNLVDEYGNKVGKHGHGFNVNGDAVDENGNVIEPREALKRDQSELIERERLQKEQNTNETLGTDRDALREETENDEVVSSVSAQGDPSMQHQEGEDRINGSGAKDVTELGNAGNDEQTPSSNREVLRSEEQQSEGQEVPKAGRSNTNSKQTENGKPTDGKPAESQNRPTAKPAKSAMAYFATASKKAYQTVDKEFSKADSGSLAGMAYNAKNGAVKIGKGTSKSVKATVRGGKKTAEVTKKATKKVVDKVNNQSKNQPTVKELMEKYRDDKPSDNKK